MTCRASCRQPSPSMAHCGACHQTFGGVTGFDEHRQGPVDARECAAPAVLGMVEHRGVWRRPMDLDVRERLRPARSLSTGKEEDRWAS